jgi:hypothetical protein
LASTSLSSCATATWCTEAYTLSVSASATNGYRIELDCNTALTNAQHCWVTAVDVRVTPGVTTGVNSSPGPLEFRPFPIELVYNQRYYQTSYETVNAGGSAGAWSAGGTATTLGMVGGAVYANALVAGNGQVIFQVPMRAAPSISYFDGAGNASKVSHTASGSSTFTNNEATFQAPFAISNRGFLFGANSATANTTSHIHYTASSEL